MHLLDSPDFARWMPSSTHSRCDRVGWLRLLRFGIPLKDLCSYPIGESLGRGIRTRLEIFYGDPRALEPFCVLGFPYRESNRVEDRRADIAIRSVQHFIERRVLEQCLLEVFFRCHHLPRATVHTDVAAYPVTLR